MTQDHAFTDAELTAFLDGEAPTDLVARIEAALTPALETRLQVLEDGRAFAMTGFDALLRSAPDMPTPMAMPARPAVERGGLAWGQVGLGMAAGVLLTVGLMQGVSLRASDVEPWHREVAAYHALYVTETLASNGQADQVHGKLAALSDLLGVDLTAAADAQDLQFRRAQQLGFDGVALVQIAYLAPGDVPVALCILDATGAAHAPRVTTVHGMSAASWSDGQRRFLLIGGTDDAATSRRARDFAARLKQG